MALNRLVVKMVGSLAILSLAFPPLLSGSRTSTYDHQSGKSGAPTVSAFPRGAQGPAASRALALGSRAACFFGSVAAPH